MTMTAYSLHQQVAAINRHDVDSLTAFYTPDATVIDSQYPDPLKGDAAIRRDFADFLRAFPDLKFTVETEVQNGGTLAFEAVGTGTNTGALATPAGEIPATNKSVTLRFAAFFQLSNDGRIAQERRYYDIAGLFQQLGISQ